jgi:hypothetical protein
MDSPGNQSDPLRPSGSKPEEPETSQMAAVPPDPQVVWPEDPLEADGRAAAIDPDAATPAVSEPVDPPWTHQMGKQPTRPVYSHPAVADDPHTAPFPTQPPQPSWTARSDPSVGKTQPPPPHATQEPAAREAAAPAGGAMKTTPPDAMKTSPPDAPADDAEDTKPPASTPEATRTAPPMAKTASTMPTAEPPGDDAGAILKTKPSESAAHEEPVAPAAHEEAIAPAASEEAAAESIPFEAEPRAQDPDSEPDLPVTAPPAIESIAASAAVPTAHVQEPAPIVEPAAAPAEPAPAVAPAPAPVVASSPSPPADVARPLIPDWAPKLPVAPAAEAGNVRWPGSNLPAWAPVAGGPAAGPPERVRITSSPAPSASSPAPSAPAPAPAASSAPAAKAPAPASAPTPGTPPGTKSGASWEIVQQKVEAAPAFTGPTPEDKSYAEWFAWAKRSGAPASACHAAAQGAFRALSTGQDMTVAVQWATLAMASPPGLVGTSRQLYCAWFSLGNIDLKLPTPQAHAFAGGAIQALEGGSDSMVAHQMGLAAAGITPR